MNAAEQILTTLAALETSIGTAPEVASWRFSEAREQQEARQHGPRWSSLTGLAESDAERMRLTRALQGLEGAGLVQCLRHQYSQRVYRIKLTEAGKKAASEVAAESVP
jgi:hypothetical protein